MAKSHLSLGLHINNKHVRTYVAVQLIQPLSITLVVLQRDDYAIKALMTTTTTTTGLLANATLKLNLN